MGTGRERIEFQIFSKTAAVNDPDEPYEEVRFYTVYAGPRHNLQAVDGLRGLVRHEVEDLYTQLGMAMKSADETDAERKHDDNDAAAGPGGEGPGAG